MKIRNLVIAALCVVGTLSVYGETSSKPTAAFQHPTFAKTPSTARIVRPALPSKESLAAKPAPLGIVRAVTLPQVVVEGLASQGTPAPALPIKH